VRLVVFEYTEGYYYSTRLRYGLGTRMPREVEEEFSRKTPKTSKIRQQMRWFSAKMKLFGGAGAGSAGKQPAEEYPNQRSHLPSL
jgi:hypothetical protein